MIIDDIRACYPNLGISIYAIVPGEPATLEVIDPAGDVFSFSAPTVAECVAKAFPELIEPEPAEPKPEAPAASVFD